ncbi:MAG: membrane protein insertion efficiency factor YidD [Acidobacteria bacterium]|nr:membrane protein insertion efficiency factor YidD [Acidobacteriota bacterium]
MKTFLLAFLGFYRQALSPVLPSFCKFYPTCSVYAAQAVERYGSARGLWMAAGRVLRCRPLRPGGYDPVP